MAILRGVVALVITNLASGILIIVVYALVLWLLHKRKLDAVRLGKFFFGLGFVLSLATGAYVMRLQGTGQLFSPGMTYEAWRNAMMISWSTAFALTITPVGFLIFRSDDVRYWCYDQR